MRRISSFTTPPLTSIVSFPASCKGYKRAIEMKVSRRDFVGIISGTVGASLCSFSPIGLGASVSRREVNLNCALLDLNSNCVLRESLQGYRAALGKHDLLTETELSSKFRRPVTIVPGIGALDPSVVETLSDLLWSGTNLLLESAAAFLNPSAFALHQRILSRHFDIEIDSPVDLWPRKSAGDASLTGGEIRHIKETSDGRESVPYVNYSWPRETNVREFSRIIPLSARPEDIIGRVGATPVALKRQVGKGTLIFLGSAMGPALRAGDLEARSWLHLAITA
jgi:hypothetical protein